MGKLRDISCWIIATPLAVVLGIGAAGYVKHVQQAGGEQMQVAGVEQEQKAEAEEEQTDIYNDETDFKFKIAADSKSVVITRYVGKKQDIHIPPKLQGLPVTEIVDHAFRRREIFSVTIPSSVTMIGERAFFNNQLASITIGTNVEIYNRCYGNDAFNDSFDDVYNSTGKAAGTYILRNGVWSRQ